MQRRLDSFAMHGTANLSDSTRWRCVNVYSFNRTKGTDLGDGRCVSEDGRVLKVSARGNSLHVLKSDGYYDSPGICLSDCRCSRDKRSNIQILVKGKPCARD